MASFGRPRRPVATLLAALPLLLAAGTAAPVRVADWQAVPPGALDLAGNWRPYGPGLKPLKQPPAIVRDGDRVALHIATAGESARLGRPVKVDVRETPWLTWEWKAVVLPEGGDVRDAKRNDQAGRILVVFEGMKGLLYVWDTTSPVGTETSPDPLEFFRRALIVVRSGAGGLGRWHRERRNVYADFRRVFEEEPGPVKLVAFESHSNDTRTRTSMLFGTVRFDPR